MATQSFKRLKFEEVHVCDFETTVFDGQTSTEVWAAASVQLNTEDVKIFGSIDGLFEYLKSRKCNLIAYFHNLKFDGAFWLDFLIKKLNLKQALDIVQDGDKEIKTWRKQVDMDNDTFEYTISDKGMWYTVTIKTNNQYIELRDSLKLLPFSVERIGNAFKTKHRKLSMEYEGLRYANCYISPQEKEYIANDVLVVKEALEVLYAEGHNKLTIGSCCMDEFKKTIDRADYNKMFPNLEDIELDTSVHKYANADAWIRKSYRGGWCYLVKGKENKIKHNGTTADVNSLYPSMMSSESGNKYPYGTPCFWVGNFIPDEALKQNRYFFVRVRTRFYIRKNYLPFIQIKGNPLYRGTESLETSDVVNPKTGEHSQWYTDINGNVCNTIVELTLTETDYYLIKEHYELVDFEIVDGCYFSTITGLFDEYIEKYKKIKMTTKGALRELAKLFLNNLYGKLASNDVSSFKVAYVDDDNAINYSIVEEHAKKPGFIAIGSAITSYARNFTIRAAQRNYYGVNKRGFIYADTDSIHCDLKPEEIKGIKVHETNFCCWKLESCWDDAIFTRQKTYIEHVTHEDLQPIEEPYYNVKCAGMPTRCKNLFLKSFGDITEEELKTYNKEEQEFLKKRRTIKDFKIGLKVPGKLMPKRIDGGIILTPTTYEMR